MSGKRTKKMRHSLGQVQLRHEANVPFRRFKKGMRKVRQDLGLDVRKKIWGC